ncbi:MAG TPA: hypothetical protein DDZ58_03355 [Achromobacter sp.]|nr:hypothetical protein [Achromobacter sp.]
MGFSALLPGLGAAPGDRLRPPLPQKPQPGEFMPAPDPHRRPQSAVPPSPAQPMGPIRRVP